MPYTTDPAREFTDLCQLLASQQVPQQGDAYLANAFSTTAWSNDFVRILAAIHERITQLRGMIAATELDEDIKESANNCLNKMQAAFSAPGLNSAWSNSVQNFLNHNNLLAIRMASAYIRPAHGYIVPQPDELKEFIDSVDDLLKWLREVQLSERDFIRYAIIEGLEGFKFRVERVGLFGWLDAMDTLQKVVAAYLVLERGAPDANQNPPYEAMVKKTRDFLQNAFQRVKFVKDVAETGDWLLRGYGAMHIAQHIPTGISALLTHGG